MKPLDPMLAIESSRQETEFAIGQLAREFGLTLRTLRFYEDKHLLHPRRVGHQRIYSQRDRARLRLILMGKRIGLSLQAIADMLDLYDLKEGQTAQLLDARDRFYDQITQLKKQRDEIDGAIAELQDTVEGVDQMLTEHRAAVA
ncbi:MAG: MerR family DNA-binding transcriptional regulator [Pseudomonadota bacterium]